MDSKNKTTKVSLRGIAKSAIESAKDSAGTWQYSFLQRYRTALKGLSDADIYFITQQLVTFLRSSEAVPRAQFKIAQLFSLMKSDHPHSIERALFDFRGDFEGIICCLDVRDPLSDPTKQLLTQILVKTATPRAVNANSIENSRIKSASVPPKTRKC
ncbi:hypothetical protein TRFO_22500 [Tritrichomonas foetus]|uniref:Uncharacterized protein n=1 Tax=Tritrichomonas foetus TaxID=1144522 RepID=A0A1J4KBQ2_9EUKA|nr:hypothetical protein TRFO_22500 [Tritrichomonas foetus]|eukprot:OHT08841.1 hypothetical protein TRFO_22500 [Tritrichomonas foetus]